MSVSRPKRPHKEVLEVEQVGDNLVRIYTVRVNGHARNIVNSVVVRLPMFNATEVGIYPVPGHHNTVKVET